MSNNPYNKNNMEIVKIPTLCEVSTQVIETTIKEINISNEFKNILLSLIKILKEGSENTSIFNELCKIICAIARILNIDNFENNIINNVLTKGYSQQMNIILDSFNKTVDIIKSENLKQYFAIIHKNVAFICKINKIMINKINIAHEFKNILLSLIKILKEGIENAYIFNELRKIICSITKIINLDNFKNNIIKNNITTEYITQMNIILSSFKIITNIIVIDNFESLRLVIRENVVLILKINKITIYESDIMHTKVCTIINNFKSSIDKIIYDANYLDDDKITYNEKTYFDVNSNLEKFAKLFTESDKVLLSEKWQIDYTMVTDEMKAKVLNKATKLCSDIKDEKSLIKIIIYNFFPEDQLFGIYSGNDYKFLDKFNTRVKQALINQIIIDKKRQYNGSNYNATKIYGGLETIDDCIDVLSYINNPDAFLINDEE